MSNLVKLIDGLLKRELIVCEENLTRAQLQHVKAEELVDYEEDVANIENAIELWERVRP